MALAYGTRLTAEPGDPSGQMEVVADIVGKWARIPNPLTEAERSGRKDGTVTTELLGTPGDPLWAWRLRLAHRDHADPTIEWAVTVVAVAESDVQVSVRLDRTRTDGTVLPPRDQPAPPRCISDLLESTEVRFVDAGRALTNTVWVVEPEEAEDFARFALDPGRRLPIFGLTPRDEDVIDGGDLLRQVLGLAHVALIRSNTSWRLNELLPNGLNVYGGAARLWWPGLTTTSSPWDHELWPGDRRARELEQEAKDLIVGAGLAAAVADKRVLGLERRQRDAQTTELTTRLAALRDEYNNALQQARSSVEEATANAVADAGARLQAAENEEMDRLRNEVESALNLAVAYEQEADEARERASLAERDRDFHRSEVARLRKAVETGSALDDTAETVLIGEIEDQITELGSVDGGRNRAFCLGSVFANTLDLHGDKYRSKAIRACAEVAIGAPGLLRQREDHALRMGDGGNDPTRVRTSDGAEGRRCYIEHNTPAARRLHYWTLPDGTIEFASVNVHDDMTIPD